MSLSNAGGAAVVFGAAAGAVLGAALCAGPAARAEGLPSLPVPPFDLPSGYFFPPGSAGTPTNVESVGLYTSEDIPWSLTGGDYQTHHVEFGNPVIFSYASDQVIDSTGTAPAVGAEWENSSLLLPLLGADFYLVGNSSLTTAAGMADAFLLPQLGVVNDFYVGPAGIFDYLVSENGTFAAIPIIDIPFETSPGAADFADAGDAGALWSDLTSLL